MTSEDVRASSEVTVVSGRIASIVEVPAAALSDAERTSVLAPSWINAHAHLELGALAGRVPADGGFVGWVAALLAERGRLTEGELDDGARASARALAATGTADVLDIDSLGVVEGALRGVDAPRVHPFVELLDASPQGPDARTDEAAERARVALEGGAGLSPHGTHTVGDALFARIRELESTHHPRAARRTVHWAESAAEVEWLRDGTGPFASFLGPSPRTSGLERLARHGLLDGTLLVHGNIPEPGELELLATARGVGIVHCPGCHSFFGRAPFPIDAYRRVGVPVLLGTDSWASNEGLDMGREVRLARAALGLSPREAFDSATAGPARWIAEPWITGTLAVGSAASISRFRNGEPSQADLLDRLTAGELELCAL